MVDGVFSIIGIKFITLGLGGNECSRIIDSINLTDSQRILEIKKCG